MRSKKTPAKKTAPISAATGTAITHIPASKAVTNVTTHVEDIVDAIRDERKRQIAQWGGDDHDRTHSAGDWYHLRRKFEERYMASPPDERSSQRQQLVKIAALAVAQLEAFDEHIKFQDEQAKMQAEQSHG